MIAQNVRDRESAFRKFWNESFGPAPGAQLDGTWPSLGTLDALTESSRRKSELSRFEEEVISGSAAYIAVLAHECLESFGAKVVVEDRGYGVILRVTEGPRIGAGEQVIMLVEAELKKLLKEMPNPFPVMNEFGRVIAPGQSVISPFAIGLCTGLFPAAQGPWKQLTADEWKDQLDHVTRHLARSCAENYGRIYAEESFGQVAEMYLNDLVFPPMLAAEDWPARLATRGLCAFLREYKLPRPNMLQLTMNLARSGDELISNAGFAAHAAILDGEYPSPDFVAMAQSKGIFVAMLRPALLEARLSLGLGGEWLGSEKATEKMERIVEFEQKMGFLPWLNIPAKRIVAESASGPLRDFIEACVMFDLPDAKSYLEDLVAEDPSDIDLRLQDVYFAVVERKIETAASKIRALLSEPSCEGDSRIFHHAGLIELLQRNTQLAERHLRKALEVGPRDDYARADILNSLGWVELTGDRNDEALQHFNEALALEPGMLIAVLNKTAVLYKMDATTTGDIMMARMTAAVPHDRRVLSSLIVDGFQRLYAGRARVAA